MYEKQTTYDHIMAQNVSQKLIESHLANGIMEPGTEIGLKIDQTLTQDATGTLVMLELEALDLDNAKTELSVQYVDHNLLQTDFKNADDHLFLRSACKKFGIWYSGPGNGVSHPVHMEKFGKPGKTLAGSDSHTPAAGGLGMLSFGAGGLDVAFAIAGEPLFLKMPKILGVKLTGQLPDWVSAKDVVLKMLEKYDVKGCKDMIIEYYGPGLQQLSTMDRHVIANMGTEMGATTTVFPSDEETKRFLKIQGREEDWIELKADEDAKYDLHDEINLSELEPLIAKPSSPGNVVPVKEVAGRPIYQSVIGSSANPGYRDFWIISEMVKDKVSHNRVSFDINPTSRQIIENLSRTGALTNILHAGGRLHQTGCMGCIGMGQAPASNQISLRTMPRNFPGRSGTREDKVYLCSPETAAASALTGEITDPRDLESIYSMKYPKYNEPAFELTSSGLFMDPEDVEEDVELQKGPNVKSLPEIDPIQEAYKLPVALKVDDNISTDEILKAGAEALPYRSNVPRISEFTFSIIDETFPERAKEIKQEHGGHIVIAGENYAQGSSREHAAIAVKYLGQMLVIAKSYARIGWQNMVNFGVVPLEFVDPGDYEKIDQEDIIEVENLREQIRSKREFEVTNKSDNTKFKVRHSLSDRQIDVLLDGGIINHYKNTKPKKAEA